MSIRVAINGYGRIGRNILRAIYESGYENELSVVAINDLADPAANAHLTEYDSIHGRFGCAVNYIDGYLLVGDQRIKVLQEREISSLPWADLDVDLVFECTGLFTHRDQATKHIDAGAGRVVISAPATAADCTVVYGVNHQTLQPEDRIISNASCTTNCLAPVAMLLNREIGIRSGLMNTIHAYTNDQHLTDAYTGDLYRARAAGLSMIPTKTGAASALGLVLPELNGKMSGLAVRIPTANVSLVDLTIQAERTTSIEEVNTLMQQASVGDLRGVLAYNDKPLVSVDFNHHPASSIFDATQTMICENQVKVLSWYDNEWGFSNRMIDLALYIKCEF